MNMFLVSLINSVVSCITHVNTNTKLNEGI